MFKIANLKQFIDTLVKDPPLREDAYQLLADRLGVNKQELVLQTDTCIEKEIKEKIEMDIKELLQGKPLYRILGYRYFWKDKFEISKETLEPRPDTEILIEACLKYLPNHQEKQHILDLGTGTGCLLLSLLREYENATGVGVDVSAGAIQTAQRNANNLGLGSRTSWQRSDWFNNIKGVYDIIISNPPYISTTVVESLSPSVKEYDPLKALDGGEDGLNAYRVLAQELPQVMHEDTLVILEFGYDQGETVPQLFKKHNFKVLEVVKDYGGNDRCVLLQKTKLI